jgi:tetracycline resistance efflux pump
MIIPFLLEMGRKFHILPHNTLPEAIIIQDNSPWHLLILSKTINRYNYIHKQHIFGNNTMQLITYSDSIFSFIVPALTIVLAITTGRVVLSLLAGAVVGALMLTGFGTESISYFWGKLYQIFIKDGSIDLWTLNIFLFLVLLGITTALLTLNGATRAFAEWAHQRVKSRRGASLLTVFLGIIIFIDDYFNAIGVGAISRPGTDSFKISRAKLAYLIDSTAAPMVILTPISSWGGYVIALLGTAFAAHHIEMGSLSAYVQMIPMNFYAILTILLVLYTAVTSFDIGLMLEHENRARDEGILYNPDNELPIEQNTIVEGAHGKVYELFITIGMLIFVTVFSLFYTGAAALASEEKAFGWIEALENSDVGLALVIGSATSMLIALLFSFAKPHAGTATLHAIYKGALSMKEAMIILTAAWLLGAIIKDLGTGTYIASLVKEHLDLNYLPALIFTLSAIMAFATGTSWGTFGIMIWITAGIAVETDPSGILILLSAVLSGAVMGDHCSPISDTTILSSIGARSNHIDHVKTQIPYALISGAGALAGFLTIGMTKSLGLAWIASSIVFIAIIFFLKWIQKPARVQA